ncbi:hypothetical protein LEP1GSC123_4193 [Leptospira borgpetersenii str. 200701203]|uniref:Uncharacterized protein n=1 Tax=Leptospira borgpetersenii str. 200701203 TaxID=1193007 RepID=M3HID6_LEPBO|nr:hypothetical protein LEP1GSC123_4193 [Leptospira borgpetersenii str. 200701203]
MDKNPRVRNRFSVLFLITPINATSKAKTETGEKKIETMNILKYKCNCSFKPNLLDKKSIQSNKIGKK